MDVVFNCIKGCVRSIFRENFDSAFEHLGKIDGQVLSILLFFKLTNGKFVKEDNFYMVAFDAYSYLTYTPR